MSKQDELVDWSLPYVDTDTLSAKREIANKTTNELIQLIHTNIDCTFIGDKALREIIEILYREIKK